VLVLGDDPALRDSLWPINALLLKALSQEILRRPNCDYPRHWFVLDEIPAMEKVDYLPDLLRRGRSKGASVLLGMHSLESISDGP
jgi:type IV secretory pathway TraG/TraD family ATPase VirD4